VLNSLGYVLMFCCNCLCQTASNRY